MAIINIPDKAMENGASDWYEYFKDKNTDIDVVETLVRLSQGDTMSVISAVHDLMEYDRRKDFRYALEKSWKFPEYYIPAFIRLGVKLYNYAGVETTAGNWVVETDEAQEDYLVWKD